MSLDDRLIKVSKMLQLPVDSPIVLRFMLLMADHNMEIANYKAEIANVTAEAEIVNSSIDLTISASAVTFAISAL